MNPMMAMLGQMIKSGGNPQQMLQQMMSNDQIMNNPIAKNIMDMAQKGDISGIEQIGRNMAKERGLDFNSEFEKFKSQFPMG